MIKPSDIFIGLRDVFGFLIPGMIFCITVIIFGPDIGGMLAKIEGRGLEVVSFVALSYCLGHVFNAIGAIAIDYAYERVLPLLNETDRGRCLEVFGKATDSFKASVLRDDDKPNSTDIVMTRISFWMDYLRLTSSVATAEIERVESIEKFLRSLCVAMLAATLFVRPTTALPSIAYGTAAAAVISFVLFVKFRLERCYRVLKYALLTLRIGSEP